MGKASIILVLGIAIAMSFLTMGAQEKRNEAVANACFSFNDASAGNLAHSGANICLSNITLDSAWTGSASASMADGTYSATCVRVPASSNSEITASGMFNETLHNVRVIVQTRPPHLRSAITAKPWVKTLGNLIVDGRDYDENENIIPNQGGLAIVSGETITRGGNSKYGGTNDSGVDLPPATDFDPSIIDENYGFDGGFPDTPDALLGLPEGTLKSMAQSGAGGSQYATSGSGISMPLRGVTYVELPDNGVWNAPNFTYCNCGHDYNSFGILVVHNSQKNALIKNLRGNFYGLIIADDVEHIHGQVMGNVTVIGDSPRGNCIGNGSGKARYSTHYIHKSLSGLDSDDVKILSWWE